MKYQFYILSFVSGFILMSAELTASRIVAPIIGTSIYSWTSIIGVILLALSAGNFTGGWLADKASHPVKTLSYVLFFAAATIAGIPYLTKIIAPLLVNGLPLVANILIISFGLFFVPSFLLGAIFPFILKLSAQTISSIGKTGGILSGASALGSIVGTFATGFFFISHIGSSQTFLMLSFLLFVFGTLIYLLEKSIHNNTLPLAIIAAISLFAINNKELPNKKIIFQDESAYYNIKVVENPQFFGGVKMLFLDEGAHSIEPLDPESAELLASYNKINGEIINTESENPQKIFILGGGSYSLPKNLKKTYPASDINVLEIDPEVQEVAEKFFGLDSNEIKTVINDARLFFKNTSKNYDIIINDAYNATISVPWHLTTQEFMQDASNNLSENGIYIANLNSSLKEGESNFLKSYYKTAKSVFPATYALKTNIFVNNDAVQNVILVSFKNPTEKQISKMLENFDVFLINSDIESNFKESIIFTDDFAPVEYQMAPSINRYHQYYLKNIYSRFLYPSEI